MRKAYPSYQETNLDWLEEIPTHWSLGKLGVCFAERNEKVSDTDYLPLSVTKNGIVPQMEHVAKTDAGDNRKKVCKNDFVINSRSDRKGSAGVSELDGSVSLISTVLEPRFYLPRFAHHLFRSYNFQEEFYRFGKGIVADLWSTRYAEMKNIVVPLLPMDEQEAIANFLDRETARIDKLIAEKQTFIKLLKEKRQALISHVVTKGLNPNVKMKDSGIEWIGDVPEHWTACRLKQISNFITSGPRGWSDLIEENGDSLFLQSGDLNNNLGLELAKAKRVTPPEGAEGIRTKLLCGDVVVCITGANTGRVALTQSLDETVYINQHLSLIRPISEKIRSKYLAYFLASEAGSKYYAITQYGLKEGLSLKNISETPVAFPKLEEQRLIEERMDKEMEKFNLLTDATLQSIDLLKEHRTALISAAVTGKIDVSHFKEDAA